MVEHSSSPYSTETLPYDRTDRTTLKRLPKRGAYDRETVYRILDEAFVCHVGFAIEGRPFVIPTSYGRRGDCLYIHGAAASRMMRALKGGIDVCVTVTLIDGLVLARSAFHHSVNYRSVVIFGNATLVESVEEKGEALRVFTDHVIPGRWDQIRPPSELELKGTTVLRLELHEVSAKVRTGPPVDDEEDYTIPVWAGVLPLRQVAASPEADPRLTPGIDPPEHVTRYARGEVRG